MRDVEAAIAALTEIADDPQAYAEDWKRRRGGKVIGIFPMNFPAEVVHAAGALPVVVQASRDAITVGRNLLYEFYCAYTRSISDQAATQKLDVFDAFFLVDHCVALLGAVDAMRYELPDKPMFLAQYMASMDEPWTPPEIHKKVEVLRSELGDFTGTPISTEALSTSILAFNRNRQMLRQVYDLRRAGLAHITATQMQVLVKSSMVMDIDEHNEVLAGIVEALLAPDTPPDLVKL